MNTTDLFTREKLARIKQDEILRQFASGEAHIHDSVRRAEREQSTSPMKGAFLPAGWMGSVLNWLGDKLVGAGHWLEAHQQPSMTHHRPTR